MDVALAAEGWIGADGWAEAVGVLAVVAAAPEIVFVDCSN